LDQLEDHKALAISAQTQQRKERRELWKVTDRDGDPQKPESWKLYDPPTLPQISAKIFHDSSGTLGFPAYVFLGHRAVVWLLLKGVSQKNRQFHWPADFAADGQLKTSTTSGRVNTGFRATDKDGITLRLDTGRFQIISLCITEHSNIDISSPCWRGTTHGIVGRLSYRSGCTGRSSAIMIIESWNSPVLIRPDT
jgi:hypothetical protein